MAILNGTKLTTASDHGITVDIQSAQPCDFREVPQISFKYLMDTSEPLGRREGLLSGGLCT